MLTDKLMFNNDTTLRTSEWDWEHPVTIKSYLQGHCLREGKGAPLLTTEAYIIKPQEKLV